MFYSNSIESEMKKFYKSLSEKDKRRYAAIEAQKLGWGGISYVMQGCISVLQGYEKRVKMKKLVKPQKRIS